MKKHFKQLSPSMELLMFTPFLYGCYDEKSFGKPWIQPQFCGCWGSNQPKTKGQGSTTQKRLLSYAAIFMCIYIYRKIKIYIYTYMHACMHTITLHYIT